MIFISHLIEKQIIFRVLTILFEYFLILLCFKLMVDSVYGRFLMGTKITVILRHNCTWKGGGGGVASTPKKKGGGGCQKRF